PPVQVPMVPWFMRGNDGPALIGDPFNRTLPLPGPRVIDSTRLTPFTSATPPHRLEVGSPSGGHSSNSDNAFVARSVPELFSRNVRRRHALCCEMLRAR